MNDTNLTFGYARISDPTQNETRQIKALEAEGIAQRYIYLDKQSGKNFTRPQYQILKNNLREGDLLVVTSIDRIGRNYNDILKEWQEITKDIKADIKVLDMKMLDTTLHKDLLGNFISDLILQILAYVAQQERENIKSRQREGITYAKANGVQFGRPLVMMPPDFEPVYASWRRKEITAKKAMQILGLKKSKFYEFAKAQDELKAHDTNDATNEKK
jgi:DNA invertase Pin-like site-specific DNA recombinase